MHWIRLELIWSVKASCPMKPDDGAAQLQRDAVEGNEKVLAGDQGRLAGWYSGLKQGGARETFSRGVNAIHLEASRKLFTEPEPHGETSSPFTHFYDQRKNMRIIMTGACILTTTDLTKEHSVSIEPFFSTGEWS
jgi:hypothetical protein